MSSPTTTIRIRVDEELKAQAAQTLASVGLTMSDAVRLFLQRVAADKNFPLTLRIPNAATLQAMAEADKLAGTAARFTNADELFDALDKAGNQ